MQKVGHARDIHSGTLLALACLAVVVAARLDAAQLSETSITERTLHRRVIVRMPPGPCSVPHAAATIAATVYVPFGAELLRGNCANDDASREPGRIESFKGDSVAAALDRLIAMDLRYVWAVRDGALVVRPVAAVRNPDHFLHQPVRDVTLKNSTADDALRVVFAPWLDYPRRRLASSGNGSISLTMSSATVLSALNTLANASGPGRWEVSYRGDSADPGCATILLRPGDLANPATLRLTNPPSGLC